MESRLGGGTSVRVYFPAIAVTDEDGADVVDFVGQRHAVAGGDVQMLGAELVRQLGGFVTSRSGRTLLIKGATYKGKKVRTEVEEGGDGKFTETRIATDVFVPTIRARVRVGKPGWRLNDMG